MIIRKRCLVFLFSVLMIPLTGNIARAGSIGFSLIDSSNPNGDTVVTVLDDDTGKPVSGATVAVGNLGETSHNPVPSAITDNLGQIHFPRPVAGNQPLSVMVTKDGYASLTVLGVQTPQMVAQLKSLPVQTQAIASGTLEGFGGKGLRHSGPKRGGSLNVGLVIPVLSASDLVDFDVNQFVSPLTDTVDVNGPKKIPSNLVLPDQNVGFLFWNFHFDKPQYRMPVQPGRELMLMGVQAEASAFDLITVGSHHGSSGVAMLDKLNFKKVGTAPAVTPQGDFESDVFMTEPLAPKHQITVSVPPFVSDVVVGAITDLGGDRNQMLLTDLKTAINASSPNSVHPVNLAAPTSRLGTDDAITVAFTDKGRRFSGIISDSIGTRASTGAFLNVDLLTDNQPLPVSVRLHAPAQGVAAVVLTDKRSDGTVYPSGFVYALPCAGDVEFQLQKIAQGHTLHDYSLVQLEFGTGFSEIAIDGNSVMKSLSRFTRTSANITP
jgi:hypothetical protein